MLRNFEDIFKIIIIQICFIFCHFGQKNYLVVDESRKLRKSENHSRKVDVQEDVVV